MKEICKIGNPVHSIVLHRAVVRAAAHGGPPVGGDALAEPHHLELLPGAGLLHPGLPQGGRGYDLGLLLEARGDKFGPSPDVEGDGAGEGRSDGARMYVI